ncbi:hypothetical protein JYQ77_12625, partial [Anaerobutyricum soehngenii]|nr:hypothetical protein [Anaerobutyricum soehngenii]
LFIGTGICITAFFFPVIHVDKVMIGDIMCLIPVFFMTIPNRIFLIGKPFSVILRPVEFLGPLYPFEAANKSRVLDWGVVGFFKKNTHRKTKKKKTKIKPAPYTI